MTLTAQSLRNRLLSRGNFRHIQLLLKVVELGGIQRAAEAVGVTQSSATQTLSYLENLLETQLFHRHARGARPTAICLDLLPMVRQIMQGIYDGSDALIARLTLGEGSMRLAASISAINGLLMAPLNAFSQQHPDITIVLKEVEGEEQMHAIQRGEVDLLVCREPATQPENWHFIALQEDALVAVCRQQHPLAAKRAITKRDALQSVWLAFPAGTAARDQLDHLSERYGQALALHPVVTRAPSVLWQILLSNDVLAVVPRTLAQPWLNTGQLHSLRLHAHSPVAPLGVLCPDEALPLAAEKFLHFMQSWCIAHTMSARNKALQGASARK